MATSNRYSICEKGQGICLCTGCKAYFCFKDFKSHRDILFNEMDGVVEERNVLQEKINKALHNKDSPNPLLVQIDEWQTSTTEKVKQAAEQARQQVTKVLDVKRVEMINQFKALSQEVIQLKEAEDFAEHDLARLKQKIQQLNQDLKQLAQQPAIKLYTEQGDQIEWNQLIYIKEQPTYTENTKYQTRGRGQEMNRFHSESLPFSYTQFMLILIRTESVAKTRSMSLNN